MASYCRQKTATVIDDLVKYPQQFGFFQTVYLLPGSVMFQAQASLEFPDQEVLSVEKADESDHYDWQVKINFFGLVGVNGILPTPYTEKAIQQQHLKLDKYYDFISFLQQRSVELFYQAWQQNQPNLGGSSIVAAQVLSLIGIDERHDKSSLPFATHEMLAHAGQFLGSQVSRNNFVDLLRSCFAVEVRLEELLGDWIEINEQQRTRLDRFNRIGFDCVLGDRVWQLHNTIQLTLGPISKQELFRYLPNGDAYQSLKSLVQYYLGINLKVRLCLQLDDGVKTGCQLRSENGRALAWNSWLCGEANNNLIQLGDLL